MDRLITFSGVDGSGKSTQIELLTRRLEEDGERPELLRKRVVLADRWVWDTTIDLQLRFPELGMGLEGWMSSTAALVPRPTASFLFLVSDRVADERQRAKQEPFPDSPDTAAARRQMYRQLAKNSNLTLIDADRNRETVHQDIWDRVVEG